MKTNTQRAPQPHQITVESRHFGAVVVSEQEIIELVAPLPPFDGLARYVLLADLQAEPFLWLQSVEQPALCFIVAPYEAVAGEAPALGPAMREKLGLGGAEPPETYVIVSPSEQPQQTTMNLLAPLYVCRRTGRAGQVIIESDPALARVRLL